MSNVYSIIIRDVKCYGYIELTDVLELAQCAKPVKEQLDEIETLASVLLKLEIIDIHEFVKLNNSRILLSINLVNYYLIYMTNVSQGSVKSYINEIRNSTRIIEICTDATLPLQDKEIFRQCLEKQIRGGMMSCR